MAWRLGALAVCFVFPAVAHADDAIVDWAKGLVTAEGIGLADRHAPSPAVARGTSRRGAEDAARQTIAKKLLALPVASGGTVAAAAKDPAVKARLDRAVDTALTLDATPETDGAWHVTMAVPVEAVRQALAAPRALPKDGDTGPAVVVVEGVTVKPAVGWRIGSVEGATLWVKDVPDWAKDAPHVKAGKAKAGEIEVAGMSGTAATLFVILTR